MNQVLAAMVVHHVHNITHASVLITERRIRKRRRLVNLKWVLVFGGVVSVAAGVVLVVLRFSVVRPNLNATATLQNPLGTTQPSIELSIRFL